jgi:hypothetical protein
MARTANHTQDYPDMIDVESPVQRDIPVFVRGEIKR